MSSKRNHLFHTFAGGAPERRRQHVAYSGRDTGITRIDLQRRMGSLGFPSQIIEVDGNFNKDQAYAFAKDYARRFGLPVITDVENLAHMQAVNKIADQHRKVIKSAIKKLAIPDDLKEDLLESASDVIENWRGWEQEKIPTTHAAQKGEQS